jgi:hypothetical protein
MSRFPLQWHGFDGKHPPPPEPLQKEFGEAAFDGFSVKLYVKQVINLFLLPLYWWN